MSTRVVFKNPADLSKLGIIDFRRLHSYWESEETAVQYLGGLLVDVADYTVYDVPDFDSYPKRDDWPGWSHAGGHPVIGRRMWNWFHHYFPDYKLSFGDQPDFQAIKEDAKGRHVICGDIGQVSPQAFAFSLTAVGPGDMWISILDEGRRHVAITFYDGYRTKIPAS